MFSTVANTLFLAACLLFVNVNAALAAAEAADDDAPAGKATAKKPAAKVDPFAWKSLGFDHAGSTVLAVPADNLLAPNALEFYYRGADNNLYGRFVSFKRGGHDKWEEPQNLGGPIISNPAGCKHPKGVTIVTISTTNNVRTKHKNEHDVFADWINHGSIMLGSPAASHCHGYFHTWTRHIDNYIYFLTRDVNGGWSGYNRANLLGISNPAAVGFMSDNQQTRGYTFVIGIDNALSYISWNGVAWQGSISGNGKFVGDPVAIVTKPSMGMNSYTGCEVYARTSIGTLMRRKFTSGDLGPWETLKFPMHTEFSTVYLSQNETTIFYSNLAGKVACLKLKDP